MRQRARQNAELAQERPRLGADEAYQGVATTSLVYHAAARGIKIDAVESILDGPGRPAAFGHHLRWARRLD